MTTAEEIRAFKWMKISTQKHQMTVLREDGLYRHVRFAQPGTGIWRFDLVTWPGHLVVTGDIEDFHFARVPDMFEFFRSQPGYINPHYWSEKLVGPQRYESFSTEVLKQRVYQDFREWCGWKEGPHRPLWQAIREEVLHCLDECDETIARQRLSRFSFGGFTFGDSWEWKLREYDWHFLVSLHSIVWGINEYDKAARHVVGVSGE